AEALACLLGHGGGDIGGRNVDSRADRGEGPRGRKPRASSDVKDAHTPCNTGRAPNERHGVSRNMGKGSVGHAAALRAKTSSPLLEPRNSFADGRFALLRARRERPCGCSAADKGDEVAASQGWHGLSSPRAAGFPHPQPSTEGPAGPWGNAESF